MADIKCPVCGESNPADQDFCQFCQSRLKPLTGSLTGADAPIHPGERPTKMNTAELEPILPQWLREARDKARKTAEEQAAQAAQEPAPPTSASAPDLLAGLQSQSAEGEEETPEWLASITGVKPKSKKTEPEPTEVHWVELGKPNEFMQQPEEPGVAATQLPTESGGGKEGELPSWMAGLETGEQGGVDELTAWLREADSRPEPPAEKAPPPTEPGPGAFEASPSSSEALPDWLKSLQAEQPSETKVQQAQPPVSETESDAEWLKNLQAVEEEGALPPSGTPAWLKEDTEPGPAEETPSWLREAQAGETEAPSSAEAIPGDLPDWLKAAAPTSSIYDEQAPAPAPAPSAEAPDWLASLQKDASAPAFETEKPEGGATAAFTEESLAGEGLFTEMPDWLSNVGPGETETASAAAAGGAESIAPGELPSWVQAMRPVESSISQTPGAVGEDQTLETRGALAGLQGVLPAAMGVGPSSKPKAYSITLQASEEQQAHALLLEQILAAETSPEPIASFAPLATQRGLRWFLAILLLVIVGGVLFLGTQAFSLPVGEPNDLRDARLITENLQPGAPVLVVIDYQPALAGEMEAIAAPMLEHAIILRQPMLTFVSS